MTWLLIISIIFLVIAAALSYFLFAPFYLEVNSSSGLYRIRFHRIASAQLDFVESSLTLHLKIFWWQKDIDLFAPKEVKVVKKEEKKAKERRAFTRRMGRKILAVIKSFQINKCFVTFDTGDMPMNGILYPYFSSLSMYTGKTIIVNFWEENEVILEIENNIARMMWAYIKT